MWRFLIIALVVVLVGCQSAPYYSTGSKGAPMTFHEPKGSDGLYEVYQSVRTLFIIITSLAFLADVGIVIYQLVVNGEAKKGILALLVLLFVLNAILLLFK
jgi:hypothetical protein